MAASGLPLLPLRWPERTAVPKREPPPPPPRRAREASKGKSQASKLASKQTGWWAGTQAGDIPTAGALYPVPEATKRSTWECEFW